MKKIFFILLNLLIVLALYILPFNAIASPDDSVSDDRRHEDRGDYDISRDDRGDIDDDGRYERERDREDVDRDEHDRDKDDRDSDRDRDGGERDGGHSDDHHDSDAHDSKEDMKSQHD